MSSSSSSAAAATATATAQGNTDPVRQNVLAALLTVVYVKGVIGVCDGLVRRRWLAPRISRKIVHIAAGSWLVFWPLFTEEHWTWKLNVLVPALYSLRLFLKGAFVKDPSDEDVRTMTRTGSPSELLKGPLFFTLIMTIVGLAFFRTQLGVLAMACLGFGDGIAPLVGYYFPLGAYPTIPFGPSDKKTLSGSLACFLAALVGYRLLRFVVVYGDNSGDVDVDVDARNRNCNHNTAFPSGSEEEWLVVLTVAAIAAATEGISGPYDNPGIAVSAVLAYRYCQQRSGSSCA